MNNNGLISSVAASKRHGLENGELSRTKKESVNVWRVNAMRSSDEAFDEPFLQHGAVA